MRYLTDQGWERQASRDGKLLKLSLGDDDNASQSVNLIFSNGAPPEKEMAEVAAALETLVQLYDVTPSQFAQALISLAYDLIFTRVPDEYVRHESIELGMANSYITNMKSFLAASATTELSGELSFKRTLKDALTYAGRCRFGHTFRGSFGFVIESPVGMNDAPQLEIGSPDVPFGRKVIERIARGLSSFNAAIAQDDASPIVVAENGMSANMCDEVIGMIEDTGISKLEMSIALSPEWGPRGQIAPQSFKIEKRYVDLLKDASSRLRKEEVPKRETIIGRIVRLETDGNPSDLIDDRAGREIWVSWDSADYGPIRVLIPLDPQSYLTALEAHRTGQLFSVSGLLKRQGRTWLLDDALTPRLIS
ncbi:hypothetical protein [Mesorhizobium sp. M7A.F.Ca.US.006.01.1.1]|uniref:hypothetical protein n=1 Tax=Mesorhizobium sp. M7A.F.Ca.US.006.01.1.1 TaxID=2496707 RepID=UPI001FE238AC|nr:hypothetical protein [Mesorhizobium sp. M7A.F.Ca.US.006.01.1.1]